MSKPLAPEVKVGFFTILGIIILLYLSLKTSGYTSMKATQMGFNVRFRSVSGLEPKSKVKLSGVEIGKVEKIALEGRHARVFVRLTYPADIRKDAKASIMTAGLLGEKYLDIEQGTPAAAVLQDGEALTNVEEPAEISDLVNSLKGSMEDVKQLTASLKNMAKTMESGNDLAGIMKNMNQSTQMLAEFIKDNQKLAHQGMANLAKISEDMAKVSPEMTRDMQKMLAVSRELLEQNNQNLTDTLKSLKELTTSMSGVLSDNRGNAKEIMDRMAKASSRLDEIIDSINKASGSAAVTAEQLEKITKKIETGEGTIGKFMTDSQVYDNLNDTLISAKKLAGKAEDFGLTVGARSEYQKEQDKWKSFFSLKLSPNPEKFYLVEATEDLRRKDLTTSRNTLNSLLYTVMIGKRFGGVTLRGGVIESSAGAGVDLHLLNDNITATAEVYNMSGYDSDAPNAQLKTRLKWDFHKYMYLYVGEDEMFNSKYRTYFAGGGIMFDDEDLKLALSLR